MTAPAKSPAVALAQVKVIAAASGMSPELVDALVETSRAVTVAEMQPRIVKAIEEGIIQALDEERAAVAGVRRQPPTFEESRRTAHRLLGDAADEIRAGDWRPPPTRAQRDAVRRALVLIGEVKAELDEAARAGTVDLDEEDR